MGPGIIGCHPGGLAVGRNGFVELALVIERNAQVDRRD